MFWDDISDASDEGSSSDNGDDKRRRAQQQTVGGLQQQVCDLSETLSRRGIAVTDLPDSASDAASCRKGKGAKEKRTLRGNTKATKRVMKQGHRELLTRLVAHYESLLREAGPEVADGGKRKKGRWKQRGQRGGKGKDQHRERAALAPDAEAAASQLDADMAMAMELSQEVKEAFERDRAFAVALAAERGGRGHRYDGP